MRHGLLVLFALLPVAGVAQVPSVALETRIRVEVSDTGKKLVGNLLSQSSDSLTVAAPWAKAVASAAITRMWQSDGRSHGRGLLRGMGIGGGIGGGVTTVIIFGAIVAEQGEINGGAFVVAGAFGLIGALEGAILGGIIGGAIGREKWKTIYSSPGRVSMRPASRGTPGMGLSIAF